VQAVSDKMLTSSNKARRHCPRPLARRHIKYLSSLFASLLFVIAFILALLTVFRTLGYTCLDASEEASFFCLVFDGKTVVWSYCHGEERRPHHHHIGLWNLQKTQLHNHEKQEK
jgi:hypothetical protein